jgi:hypothetical protein
MKLIGFQKPSKLNDFITKKGKAIMLNNKPKA